MSGHPTMQTPEAVFTRYIDAARDEELAIVRAMIRIARSQVAIDYANAAIARYETLLDHTRDVQLELPLSMIKPAQTSHPYDLETFAAVFAVGYAGPLKLH